MKTFSFIFKTGTSEGARSAWDSRHRANSDEDGATPSVQGRIEPKGKHMILGTTRLFVPEGHTVQYVGGTPHAVPPGHSMQWDPDEEDYFAKPNKS